MSDPIVLEDDPAPASPVEVPVPDKSVKVDKVLNAILDKIAPASVGSKYLKVLIYGEPGVGKTTFAATAPSPLLIDVERGSRSVLNVNNPVDVLEYKSVLQVEKIIEYLEKGNPTFDKYETIVIDTITELQARLVDQQLRQAGGGAPLYKADWGVWGENAQRLRMMFSMFRDINKNLIATAHTKSDKDDETGIDFIRPALTPGLAKAVNGMFDIVGQLKINNKGDRVLRLAPTASVIAKSRVALPPLIVNPTWASLIK
jgi:phage nucleotide-binding protein